MSELHADFVKMTVTGTPGTGTVTLNAASTGYRSFATAYGANATVCVTFRDGTAWETATGCTYTHSGTTLSRGTFVASSTGSALSLTSSATAEVSPGAALGNRMESAALTQVAGTDANTTMAVGNLYLVPGSSLTANRTYTLPTTAAVGDRIGLLLSSGHATNRVIVTAAASDTLQGVAGGTEFTSLFNAFDILIVRCAVADTTWVVEAFHPVNSTVLVTNNGSSAGTALTRNAVTQLTDQITTVASDPSGEWDATNKRYTPKRSGLYLASAAGQIASVQSGNGVAAYIYLSGSSSVAGSYQPIGATGYPIAVVSGAIRMTTGQYLDFRMYYDDASTNRSINPNAANTFFTAVRIGD